MSNLLPSTATAVSANLLLAVLEYRFLIQTNKTWKWKYIPNLSVLFLEINNQLGKAIVRGTVRAGPFKIDHYWVFFNGKNAGLH